MSVSDDIRDLAQHTGELTQAVVGLDQEQSRTNDRLSRMEGQLLVLVAKSQEPDYWHSDPWVRRGVVFFFIFAFCMLCATIGGIMLGDGSIIKQGVDSMKLLPGAAK